MTISSPVALALALTLPLALFVPSATASRIHTQELKVTADRYIAAFNRGDAAHIKHFYARHAVLRAPKSPSVRGRARIARAYAVIFRAARTVRARTDTALVRVARGRFVQTGSYEIVERSGAVARGRFVRVWKRAGKRFELVLDASTPTSRRRSRKPGRRARDVKIALRRYMIVLNRRDASQLGRFYARRAFVDFLGMPSVSGRRRIVRFFDGLFDGELLGARVSRVAVAPLSDGTYESRGRFTATLGADEGTTEAKGAFRFVWRFGGARQRPFILEGATELDD